jgi:cytochrome c-type biogenesis protein CcmH/NrfF
MANAVAEATWIRRRPSSLGTVVFCDNVSAVYMSTNPVQHQRTKHIEIDLHFVRDRVHGSGSRVACSLISKVRRHLDEGSSITVVSGFLVQSQCPYSSRCDCGGVLEICHIM